MNTYRYLLPAALLLVLLSACRKPAPVPPPLAEKAIAAEASAPDLPPPPSAKRRVLDVPMWTQTIAVLDTRIAQVSPVTVQEDFSLPLTEKIEAAFLATGRFEVVERARLDAVKHELTSTTDSLWFDQTSVAKMGKFLGARYIILPTARLEVGVMSSRLDLQLKVVDTETASTVQSFSVRTTSSSLSINSSITACMERIRLEIGDAISQVYPAQAVIVHSPHPGVFWAEAKQTRTAFHAGQKVRIMESKDVLNPVKGTLSTFTAEIGRGYVQSVESFGVVVKAKGVKADEGWIVEVLP